MNPTEIRAYLAALCDDIDHNRRPRRRRWGVHAFALAGLLSTACGDKDDSGDMGETDCADELDNDGDGAADCDDDDCLSADNCGDVALYGATFEEDCGNLADDDGDGLVDCDDDDCADAGDCVGDLYGAAFEDCDNGVDDDGDGLVDCDDADCVEDEACQALLEYGAGFSHHDRLPIDVAPKDGSR